MLHASADKVHLPANFEGRQRSRRRINLYERACVIMRARVCFLPVRDFSMRARARGLCDDDDFASSGWVGFYEALRIMI